jgi:broad specificity phosphatase PhoE
LTPGGAAGYGAGAVDTKVFLVRHGITDWHRERKVMGHRDVALNEEGVEQARAAAASLAGSGIAEVISSPLVRALQTAEIIGQQFGIEVARDPRLIDLRVGPRWEGKSYEEVAAAPEYKQFLADPTSDSIPGAENLHDAKLRAVAAIEQALRDNPSGESICVITHAGIIRVLITHYMGSPPANYHRVRVAPGSISILSFADDRELPRVLAVNWSAALPAVLGMGGD